MKWFAGLTRRLQQLLQRKQWQEDLSEEMRLHLDLRAAEAQANGVARADAYAGAKRRFGNLSRVREESREAWGWAFLDTAAQDVRYGMRALIASPTFTLAALASLALGIGANTAIFSILNAVLLRALPVKDPAQLVELRIDKSGSMTNPIWEQVRDYQQAFSGVFAYGQNRFNLSQGGESEFVAGAWVSGDYFRVLGVTPLLGRLLDRQDDVHGGGSAGAVAVISYGFWQAHFAGDPHVLGQTIRLSRHAFAIVGITPRWFRGLDTGHSYDVAIPIGCEPLLHTDRSWLEERSTWWLRMVGRLREGDTLSKASSRINSIAGDVFRSSLPRHWSHEEQAGFLRQKFNLRPAGTGFSVAAEQYKKALWTLMAVVGLVLLIACANLANLMLARSAARQREISVRMAIGAARGRVIRQLLTESLLLASLGAIAGLLFSFWGSRLLVRMLSTFQEPLQLDLSPDMHLLGFTGAIVVLTAILFGLLPAFRATRLGAQHVLRESARGSIDGASRFTLGKVLVTAQVALSLVLVVGAGLFLGTFRNLLTTDPGFDRHNVLLVSTAVPESQLPQELRLPMFDRILTTLRSIPGVQSASGSIRTPITDFFWNEDTRPEGYKAKAVPHDTLVYFNRVAGDYFRTFRTPILRGRDFSERDNRSGAKVMIVSESTARHFWGDANPLGRTIGLDRMRSPGAQDLYQVVGEVKDAKYGGLDERMLNTAYVSLWQDAEPRPEMQYEIRYKEPVEPLIAAVRDAIGGINHAVSLEFRTLESQVNDSLAQQRAVALLSSFFGGLALILAMVGLYGVIAYTAVRRRSEIGIRMALGAQPELVVRLILRDVLLMLCVGIALGLLTSLALARLVTGLLYGVRPSDPLTMGVAAVVLAVAAVTAGYLPARRASLVDPMTALREE